MLEIEPAFTVERGEIAVPVYTWSPDGCTADPRPLLIVHDGLETNEGGRLTKSAERWIQNGEVTPFNIALLDPGVNGDYNHRAMYYTTPNKYSEVFKHILKKIDSELNITKTIGMGASLGALSMLAMTLNRSFEPDGLFLQSPSIHLPEHGGYTEEQYIELYAAHPGVDYENVKKIGREALHKLCPKGSANPLISLTCSLWEENYGGNVRLNEALTQQELTVAFARTEGGHDRNTWSQSYDTHLKALLQAVFVDASK